MKKIALTVVMLTMLITITGANFYKNDPSPKDPLFFKKPCYGYTIIEFGIGLNCNGDTVKLVKVKGGQALAREEFSKNENSIVKLIP